MKFLCRYNFLMIVLLIAVVLGTIFAVFSTQNTESVNLNFGSYFVSSPIYLVILIPLLLGILIAFLFYTLRSLSHELTESEQKSEIRKLRTELAETIKKAHKLELENVKMKKENGEFDEDSIE